MGTVALAVIPAIRTRSVLADAFRLKCFVAILRRAIYQLYKEVMSIPNGWPTTNRELLTPLFATGVIIAFLAQLFKKLHKSFLRAPT